MHDPEDAQIDEEIRRTVASPPPPEVEQRLRAQLDGFRSRLRAEDERTTSQRRRWVSVPSQRLGLVASCAAAAILIAVAGVLFRPQTSFAEVTSAVLKQPWIHQKVSSSDQSAWETWYSPARDILASRRGETLEFEDYRTQVYHSYDPADQTVYRGPVVWRSRAEGLESMAAGLKVLFEQKPSDDRSLAPLGFLGPDRDRMKVVSQKVEKLSEQGRDWLVYRLEVNDLDSGQPLRMLFRVDARTNLPHLCRIEGVHDGKPASLETVYDYPEKGPADIYDLGAPRTAKFIDRLPDDDIKRILDTLQAGRERMDNYRAVFINRCEALKDSWYYELPIVFYRKGQKLRADYVGSWKGDLGAVVRPAAGANQGKWWFERLNFFRLYPQYVFRDTDTFTSNIKQSTDRDGTQHLDIASVQRTASGNNPGVDFPPEWSMRPEYACRPPLGIGGQQFEPVLDLHPASGPPGCILLRVRHTSTKDRINDKGIGIPDAYRYWLDPQRDYIVMRGDMVMQDGNGKEVIYESDVTEETARSPQGVWYATRVRRKFPSRVTKKDFLDQVYLLYLDFNADLPDSLFEPPTPGRLY
jgi:hypothetical protein